MEFAPQELRTYFTTFSTQDRRRIFQVTTHAELMVSTLMEYRAQGRFALHSYVVMPDHVHLLITPAPDISFEKALQYVRGGFSFKMKSKMPVWQRGHFDKRVPGQVEYDACVRYITRIRLPRGWWSAQKISGFRLQARWWMRCRHGCRKPGAEAPRDYAVRIPRAEARCYSPWLRKRVAEVTIQLPAVSLCSEDLLLQQKQVLHCVQDDNIDGSIRCN